MGPMKLFTGTLDTIEGPVRCVGTYSEQTGGGVILSPRFRLEGFLIFHVTIAALEGPTIVLDIRVDTLRTTARGAGYLLQYIVVGGPGDA
jgi:hypothetical protein